MHVITNPQQVFEEGILADFVQGLHDGERELGQLYDVLFHLFLILQSERRGGGGVN